MPYDRDILVRLIVKKEKAAFDYQSVRNSQTDFPVLTCAVPERFLQPAGTDGNGASEGI